MDNWRDAVRRPASRLEVGGFRPTGQVQASSFGRVSLAAPDEEWPSWKGEPLLPLCQLNLTTAPYVPPSLRDVGLITIFIAADYHLGDTLKVRNRTERTEGPWCLRSYEGIEGLVEISAPLDAVSIRPFEARWRSPEVDYPTHEMLPIELPREIEDDYYDLEGVRTLDGTKLGGWPHCIQSEPWWEHRREGAGFRFVLQVDSEEKCGWQWGDQGAAYFARNERDLDCWAFDWQCL